MSDDQIEDQRKMILEDMKRTQEQMAASQPPMPGMPPMGGAPVAPEMPAAGESPAEAPPGDEPTDDVDTGAEAQIDDVEQILDRLEGMEFEEDDESVFSDEDVEEEEEELDELTGKKKVGRPPEGIKFGTDDHHLGRDPLGHKENQKTYKRRGLSFETKNILDQLDLDKLPSTSKLDKKIII
jgi:hypothetical protein